MGKGLVAGGQDNNRGGALIPAREPCRSRKVTKPRGNVEYKAQRTLYFAVHSWPSVTPGKLLSLRDELLRRIPSAPQPARPIVALDHGLLAETIRPVWAAAVWPDQT